MSDTKSVFAGCLPALMTPCDASGEPDFDALAARGAELVDAGMRGVVYCGSVGEWPLLSDRQRREGVQALVDADVPVVVGTGAKALPERLPWPTMRGKSARPAS